MTLPLARRERRTAWWGAGAALLERQARLRAVEGLDLALLVDRKHQGFVGRGKIETDDILDLGDEVRVVGDLEVAHQMRFEPVLFPDALHARMADTHRIGHAAHTPVRGVGRPFLDCFLDRPELDVVGNRLAAGRLGASLDEAADAGLDEVVLPAPYRRLRNADRAHDGHDAVALRRHQHDPCSFDDLLTLVSVCRDPLKRGTILRTEPDSCLLPVHANTES